MVCEHSVCMCVHSVCMCVHIVCVCIVCAMCMCVQVCNTGVHLHVGVCMHAALMCL